MSIRRLRPNEKIPYDLLLLADETKEAIDKYIFDSEIYLFDLDKKTIGVYALQAIDQETAEIKNIAVCKNHQGKGRGTFMLQDAVDRARKNGFKRITIGTGDASFKQLKLYEKMGFRRYEVKTDFFIDNYPDPIFENGNQLKHMIMLEKEIYL